MAKPAEVDLIFGQVVVFKNGVGQLNFKLVLIRTGRYLLYERFLKIVFHRKAVLIDKNFFESRDIIEFVEK